MGETAAASARQAGLGEDMATLLSLLEKPEVLQEINRWQEFSQRRSCRQTARQGLERLAFGSIEDAVCLVYQEELPGREKLAQMDLTCVSEMKRPKGGGCEIKLVDRMKALELLANLHEEGGSEAGAEDFLRALEQSSADCFAPEEPM